MFGIESKTVGIYNFDYFSIDMAERKYRMGGKEYPLGTACCAVANLPKDTTEELLRLGAELNESRCKLLLLGGYNRELFQETEKHILNILTYIQRIEPFTFFDILRAMGFSTTVWIFLAMISSTAEAWSTISVQTTARSMSCSSSCL